MHVIATSTAATPQDPRLRLVLTRFSQKKPTLRRQQLADKFVAACKFELSQLTWSHFALKGLVAVTRVSALKPSQNPQGKFGSGWSWFPLCSRVGCPGAREKSNMPSQTSAQLQLQSVLCWLLQHPFDLRCKTAAVSPACITTFLAENLEQMDEPCSLTVAQQLVSSTRSQLQCDVYGSLGSAVGQCLGLY